MIYVKIRDHLAMEAMRGFLSNSDHFAGAYKAVKESGLPESEWCQATLDDIAKAAYGAADAMIKVRGGEE